MRKVTYLSEKEIEALKLALRYKDNLAELGILSKDITTKQGPSVGGVLFLQEICKRLGITDSLGNNIDGKLAL